jgi:hypothetical protein
MPLRRINDLAVNRVVSERVALRSGRLDLGTADWPVAALTKDTAKIETATGTVSCRRQDKPVIGLVGGMGLHL